MSQREPEGNTSTSGPVTTDQQKQKPNTNQLYCWFFTCQTNEPLDPDPESLHEHLKEFCKKFTFQLERGEENGKLHYQGWFSLKQKERFSTVINLLSSQFHLEPARDNFAAIKYCSKIDTRVDGPWNENSTFIQTIKTEELYKWQQELKNLLLFTEPDDRKIIIVLDKTGGKGKSAFCKYMQLTYKKVLYTRNGRSSDIGYMVKNPRIVLWDITRSIEGHLNYDMVEQIKDGAVFSGKYESGMKIFNPPHLVLFMNWSPDYSKLSADRWIVWDLSMDSFNEKVEE